MLSCCVRCHHRGLLPRFLVGNTSSLSDIQACVLVQTIAGR